MKVFNLFLIISIATLVSACTQSGTDISTNSITATGGSESNLSQSGSNTILLENTNNTSKEAVHVSNR